MFVYKQYDQEQLDLQYNNRHHVPDFESYLAKWESLSRLAEKKLRVRKEIPYGDLPRETLDVFPAQEANAKMLIFIHGGYWHLFDKSLFYFVADAFGKYGITTILLNYPLAPAVTMDQIVASCRKAVRWVHQHGDEVNGDPDQLYVAGHSAGAHLACMILASEAQPGQGMVKGVCAISGLYNLVPIQRSYVNNFLGMDDAMAMRNSPAQRMLQNFCPMILAVGTAETEEFKQQSIAFVSEWGPEFSSMELLALPGLNHFSILDSLSDPEATLHHAICNMMTV